MSNATTYDVGIVVACRFLRSPWADHVWQPYAVLPVAPEMAPWTRLGAAEGATLFYAGSRALALHPGVAAYYRDNLESGRPSLWVALTPSAPDRCEVTAVTADPYEGEALTEGLGTVVEAVAMPTDIRERLAAFVAAFLVEQPFFKRQRDRAFGHGGRK